MHHKRVLPYFCLQLMWCLLMVTLNYNNYLQNEAESLWKGKSLTHTHWNHSNSSVEAYSITHLLVSCFQSPVVANSREGWHLTSATLLSGQMQGQSRRGDEQRWRRDQRGTTGKNTKYIPMSKSYMLCAYQRVLTKIISVCFFTFLLWPPQLPQQPKVNQRHLMQQSNDAFHIQHTTTTTFSPLSPPLIYISILLRPLLFFTTPPPTHTRRLCFSASLPLCLRNLLAPLHLFSRLSLLLRLFPLRSQHWCI